MKFFHLMQSAYSDSVKYGYKYAGDMLCRTSSFSEKAGYSKALRELLSDCSDYEIKKAYNYFLCQNNKSACKVLYNELEKRNLIEILGDGNARKIGYW